MTYCDVSLPVPLDQSFTYWLPETLRHRVAVGCRVLVPFGPRKLTGVVVRVHDDQPEGPLKEVLRLVDEEPVLGRRAALARPLDLAVLLRAAGRGAARHDSALWRSPQEQAIFAHRCRPRCRAPAAVSGHRRRSRAASAALARSSAALGAVFVEESFRKLQRIDSLAREEGTSSRRGSGSRSRSLARIGHAPPGLVVGAERRTI